MTRPARVAVLDYGIGNLRSAEKALVRAGADAFLTDDPLLIESSDAVVLPGVGSFGACVDALRARGLDSVVVSVIEAGLPFLGICVGMQMLFESSEEDPGVRGLAVLEGDVRAIPGVVPRPQMQWNTLERVRDDALLSGLGAAPWMYFVHSFHCVARDEDAVSATCSYGTPLVAAVRRGNVCAVQFHPEKSGDAGIALLSNFVAFAGRR